jgi:hypothetical protein
MFTTKIFTKGTSSSILALCLWQLVGGLKEKGQVLGKKEKPDGTKPPKLVGEWWFSEAKRATKKKSRSVGAASATRLDPDVLRGMKRIGRSGRAREIITLQPFDRGPCGVF